MRPEAAWIGAVSALLALAVAATLWWTWTQPQLQAVEARITRMGKAAQRATDTPNRPNAAGTVRSTGATPPLAAQLIELSAGRATAAHLPDRLAALQDGLHRYKLTPTAATYQTQPAGAPGVSRCEVRLDVTGSYVGARFFIRSALAADRLLALRSLEVEREVRLQSDPATTRMQLAFSLLLAEAP